MPGVRHCAFTLEEGRVSRGAAGLLRPRVLCVRSEWCEVGTRETQKCKVSIKCLWTIVPDYRDPPRVMYGVAGAIWSIGVHKTQVLCQMLATENLG